MRIGVDIDGVVADFVGDFLPLVKKRYGVTLRERDITVHDLYLLLGVAREEAMELIREALRLDLRPYPGAVGGLKRLSEAHEISLVTARPVDMMPVTRDWLARHRVPHGQLLHFEQGLKHKNEQSFDVFIDDHLQEAMGLVGKVPNIIIFDHPWNRTLDVAGLFRRARNWRQVLSIIEELE